jgi:hypothetical protein
VEGTLILYEKQEQQAVPSFWRHYRALPDITIKNSAVIKIAAKAAYDMYI